MERFTNEAEAELCGIAFGALETKHLTEEELKRVIQSTIKDDEANPEWAKCSWVIMKYKKSQTEKNGMTILEILEEGKAETKWAEAVRNSDPSVTESWKKWSEEWNFKTSLR